MKIKAGERKLYIPFSAAAKAADISQKRIRNWLDKEDVYLDAEEYRADPAKHRRFSRLDVARFGLVARLTALGFSAERASRMAEQCLYESLCIWRKKRGIEEDETAIAKTFHKPAKDFNIPKIRYQKLTDYFKKIGTRPDPLALNSVESVALCGEDEILEALRESMLIVEVIGYDIHEHYGPSMSDQPNYATYVRSKTEDPMKSAWPSDSTDTRLVIQVWKMIKRQDEALKTAEAEE